MRTICSKCKKPGEFGLGKSWCRACCNERSIQWYENNKEQSKARAVKWRKENPERSARTQLKAHLKRHYRASLEDYDRLVEKQDGRCAICLNPIEGKNRHVDHDHKTKALRGLLCSHHNTGLGMFQDNPEWLRRAADYLEGK